MVLGQEGQRASRKGGSKLFDFPLVVATEEGLHRIFTLLDFDEGDGNRFCIRN